MGKNCFLPVEWQWLIASPAVSPDCGAGDLFERAAFSPGVRFRDTPGMISTFAKVILCDSL